MAAIEALGLYSYKRGRPGTRGYGISRRCGRITFLPILDADGKEIEPPTDEWARFSTTKEAKMAARSAYKRAQGSKLRSRNRITSVVIQKSDHVTAKHNGQLSAETPMNTGSAESEIGSLSRSIEAYQPSPIGDAVGAAMQQYSCVGTGKYEISKDPAAMREYSCVSARVRFPLLRLVA